MIDLHAHLLPGADDGPATLEDAAAMCRIAAADGIEALVVTPHQRHALWENGDRGLLAVLLARLREAVGPAPCLHLGAEIRVDSELLAEMDLYPEGGPLPLAGSRYLLLEFPSHGPAPDPLALIHELVLAGWFPIVAHPERIPWMAEDGMLLDELAERGALLELTAMSILGGFGRQPQKCCAALLDRGRAHVVASDAHDRLERVPRLAEAYRAVAAGWGETTARRLFVDNPAAVLADRAFAVEAS